MGIRDNLKQSFDGPLTGPMRTSALIGLALVVVLFLVLVLSALVR